MSESIKTFDLIALHTDSEGIVVDSNFENKINLNISLPIAPQIKELLEEADSVVVDGFSGNLIVYINDVASWELVENFPGVDSDYE